jgi:hypothetical protein
MENIMEERTISLDDKEYKLDDLNDQQKYFVSQLDDIRAQKAQTQFRLDQILASESVFTDALIKSLKEGEEKVEEEIKEE